MSNVDPLLAVISILTDHTGFGAELITPATDIQDELGIDSIDAVELLITLEKQTGTRLDVESLDDIRTVGDIVDRLRAAQALPVGDPA